MSVEVVEVDFQLLVAGNVAAERGSSNFVEVRKLPDNCDDSIDQDQACLDVHTRFPAVKILTDLSVVISIVLIEPKHHKYENEGPNNISQNESERCESGARAHHEKSMNDSQARNNDQYGWTQEGLAHEAHSEKNTTEEEEHGRREASLKCWQIRA